MAKQRLLLIGGFPKGYDTPFHPDTLSGKRLLKLKERHNLFMEFLDLWNTDKEEKEGIITLNKISSILGFSKTHRIIALGKHVWKCMMDVDEFRGLDFEYLPHPASRRKKDLMALEMGLVKTIDN